MRTLRFAPLAFACLAATLLATPARAQQTPSTGGLQVTELENGFVVAPDVRFTTINDRSATLAGAYGGYEMDRTFFIGAAAYWLTNRDDDFKTQYGGGLVKWTFGGHRAVGVSTGAFVGVGSATLSRTYGDVFGVPAGITPNQRMLPNGRPLTVSSRVTASTPVRIRDEFFVAEPQVNVLWRVAPWMRVDVGGGYRFIGASNLLQDQLRGASGSVALRFGGN